MPTLPPPVIDILLLAPAFVVPSEMKKSILLAVAPEEKYVPIEFTLPP